MSTKLWHIMEVNILDTVPNVEITHESYLTYGYNYLLEGVKEKGKPSKTS